MYAYIQYMHKHKHACTYLRIVHCFEVVYLYVGSIFKIWKDILN